MKTNTQGSVDSEFKRDLTRLRKVEKAHVTL